jgi:hypothetical protein
MNRISTRADGSAIVNEDLKPLWHGEVTEHSFTSRAAMVQELTIPLVKNTNNVRIVLQHLSGSPVEVEKFTFTITDDNGWMDYDNTLIEDEQLTYYAWRTDDGVAELNADGSRAQTSIGVAIAELTVGRLVLENNPILTITNDKGEKVLSVRNAIMSDSEIISVASSLGRICASPLVSCPPAIPIVVSGEKITQQSIALLLKYGITEIEVTK